MSGREDPSGPQLPRRPPDRAEGSPHHDRRRAAARQRPADRRHSPRYRNPFEEGHGRSGVPGVVAPPAQGAAETIGLVLEPAEAMMLAAAPAEQLATVIARTTVPLEHRRVFLGHAAAAMLATLALMTTSCGPPPVGGSRPPERPTRPEPSHGLPAKPPEPPRPPEGTPDEPVPAPPAGVTRPPLAGGSRPPSPDIKPPPPVQPPTPDSAPDQPVLPEVPPTPSRVVGGSRPGSPGLETARRIMRPGKKPRQEVR